MIPRELFNCAKLPPAFCAARLGLAFLFGAQWERTPSKGFKRRLPVSLVIELTNRSAKKRRVAFADLCRHRSTLVYVCPHLFMATIKLALGYA